MGGGIDIITFQQAHFPNVTEQLYLSGRASLGLFWDRGQSLFCAPLPPLYLIPYSLLATTHIWGDLEIKVSSV